MTMKPGPVFLALSLIASSLAWSAGFLEREVYFSEADIQAQVAKSATMQKNYASGALIVSLNEAPTIRLGNPEGKAALAARLNVTLLGNPPLPVDVDGSSGVRYDDNAKAFFLEDPVVHLVQARGIPREAEPIVRQTVTQLINAYFRARPVYVLRENGPAQERTARWLLRSIRIEPGRVAAILSPV